MSLFQSNLRKQIRNLPKILNFVKIIHYYSKLFTGVLNPQAEGGGLPLLEQRAAPVRRAGERLLAELLHRPRRAEDAHSNPPLAARCPT